MRSPPSSGPHTGSTFGEIAADAPEHSHTPTPSEICKPPPAVAAPSFPINLPSVSDTAAPLTQAFADLAPSDAASLLIAASDLTMLVDDRGIVRDLQVGSAELAELEHEDWLGRAWSEIVTVESRPKIKALLHEPHQASAQASTQRWRHINHTTPQGQDPPSAPGWAPRAG